jgi:hypothetical protein
MSRIKELLSELRDVTERSRPNTMANDQINLIEAIEFELNKDYEGPVELSVKDEAKKQAEDAPVDVPSESETLSDSTPKRGRKSAKQD